MKMKALLASLVVSAGLCGSAQQASAGCGNVNFIALVEAYTADFSTTQQIIYSSGTAWLCTTVVNEDKVKYFTKGTASRYEVNMSPADNCKIYRTTNGGGSWNFWFSGSPGTIGKNKSQIGSNTNGIRLGC